MHSAVCRYGVPMQKGPDKQLESALEKAKEFHEKMSDTTEPMPMPISEADRRALMNALANGKEVVIEWRWNRKASSFKTHVKPPFVVVDGRNGLISEDAIWLSWSEVREPRVFEFEVSKGTALPWELATAIVEGARFKARYEEILP